MFHSVLSKAFVTSRSRFLNDSRETFFPGPRPSPGLMIRPRSSELNAMSRCQAVSRTARCGRISSTWTVHRKSCPHLFILTDHLTRFTGLSVQGWRLPLSERRETTTSRNMRIADRRSHWSMRVTAFTSCSLDGYRLGDCMCLPLDKQPSRFGERPAPQIVVVTEMSKHRGLLVSRQGVIPDVGT